MKDIIICGAQGCGKGTQGDLLVEKYGMGRIIMGDECRKHPVLRAYADRGENATDDVVIGVARELLECQGRRDVIIDGFPRTPGQAAKYVELGRNTVIVELVIPRDLAIARVGKRVAEAIAAGKPVRSDDRDPATVARRLDGFERQTRPAIDALRRANVPYFDVPGHLNVNAVHGLIVEHLGLTRRRVEGVLDYAV